MSNEEKDVRTVACLVLTLTSWTAVIAQEPVVPLCPGLTIVTAIQQPEGDYESIKTVLSADEREVRIRYSVERPNTDMLSSSPDSIVRETIFRTVLREDLRSAERYQQLFVSDSDETIPGTTAIGTSTAVLRSLLDAGRAQLAYSNLPGGITGMTTDPDVRPNFYDYFQPGELVRVGRSTVRVLVDERPVDLPAVHAEGRFVDEPSEFFFLDDPKNPLTLRFRIGIGAIPPMQPDLAETCAQLAETGLGMFRRQCLPEGGDTATLQVVKITTRCDEISGTPGGGGGSGPGAGAAPEPDGGGIGEGGGGAGRGTGSSLEQELADSGRVEVYSIYFEFNSDAIREESEETLEEIAAVLRRHPEWKLSIEGHTDSIASDQYNLDLSERRARAVKTALVERYGVDAGRLATQGFGESSPKDTNETLEGRARNRRVELVRGS